MDEFYHIDQNDNIMLDVYDEDIQQQFLPKWKLTHFGDEALWILGILINVFLHYSRFKKLRFSDTFNICKYFLSNFKTHTVYFTFKKDK